jgi:uncharacterized repeat protein (TIGR04076 family)
MPLGNKPGKEFIIERTTPTGMCMSVYQAISPAIQVLRFGRSFPWEKNPDVAHFACPDPVRVDSTHKTLGVNCCDIISN